MNYRLILVCILIAGIYFSCTDQNYDALNMGEEFVDGESGIVLIDSLAIELSTVLIDSIETSNTGVALVGTYKDEVFGNVQTESVFRIGLPGNVEFKDDDVFDSITICLRHNNYAIGDTSQLFHLKINELNTNFEELDQYTFYNTSRVSVKDQSLGELSYYPKPSDSEEIEVRIRDDFGQELFGLFMNDADEISSESAFQEYFKGVVLGRSTFENQSVIGYSAVDTSLYLKMYYHRLSDYKEELELVFNLESSNYQFNCIEADRAGTNLAPLVEQSEKILSEDTDNKAFIQGGSGLMTKVKFPGLADVFQLVLLDQIIKAELILVPTRQTEDINDLPTNLLVYESNNINAINNILTTSDGSAILSMNLIDNLFSYEEDEYYSIDVTQYIIAELLDGYFDPDYSFLIGLSNEDEHSTMTSLIIGGEKDADFVPKLKLYTYYY
ncbi:DUF4270 domain-containing protein [Labilibacter sediminis]|nr:DUF4270 domain-containing protein [Labilibacter sediminis]